MGDRSRGKFHHGRMRMQGLCNTTSTVYRNDWIAKCIGISTRCARHDPSKSEGGWLMAALDDVVCIATRIIDSHQ